MLVYLLDAPGRRTGQSTTHLQPIDETRLPHSTSTGWARGHISRGAEIAARRAQFSRRQPNKKVEMSSASSAEPISTQTNPFTVRKRLHAQSCHVPSADNAR